MLDVAIKHFLFEFTLLCPVHLKQLDVSLKSDLLGGVEAIEEIFPLQFWQNNAFLIDCFHRLTVFRLFVEILEIGLQVHVLSLVETILAYVDVVVENIRCPDQRIGCEFVMLSDLLLCCLACRWSSYLTLF
jgi:hypothetical protein